MFPLKLCTQFTSCCEKIFVVHGIKRSKSLCRQQVVRSLSSAQPNIAPTKSQTNVDQITPESKQTFSSMLRNSVFVQVGEHKNVEVVGKIVQVQDEHIYVDFGGKFHCVCNLGTLSSDPDTRAKYTRGKHVVLSLQDFELSARFLGATRDTTLLEADGNLLGLYKAKNIKISETDDEITNQAPEHEPKDEIVEYESKDDVIEYESKDDVIEYESKDKIVEYESKEGKIMKQTKGFATESKTNEDVQIK